MLSIHKNEEMKNSQEILAYMYVNNLLIMMNM